MCIRRVQCVPRENRKQTQKTWSIIILGKTATGARASTHGQSTLATGAHPSTHPPTHPPTHPSVAFLPRVGVAGAAPPIAVDLCRSAACSARLVPMPTKAPPKRAAQELSEPEEAPVAKGPRAAKSPAADLNAAPSVRPAATAEAGPWPRWVDPGDEGAQQVSTYRNMKILIPWLRQELPAHLKRLGLTSGEAVAAVSPLVIRASTESSALSSYKEVWTPANCKVAIASTGMYEAGGSLMWLDPGFVGEFVSLLHAEPAWSVVADYQKEYFSHKACHGKGRLVFPCGLEAYSLDESRDWSTMPSSLCLLGGQAIVFAWYLAAARAMVTSDDTMLRELWQAALTCTIQLKITTSASKLALSAMELSERYISFAEMSDTFPHCAVKVQKIIDDTEGMKKLSAQAVANQLREMNVRYRGTLVTKGMILSVGHVHELFDESGLSTLQQIEKEFGRDLLSTNYTKLRSFMVVVRNHAASVAPHGKIKEVPPVC